MGTPHQPRDASAADADTQEEVGFLDESLPVLDDEEMEDLYRHFLLDDMPEVCSTIGRGGLFIENFLAVVGLGWL